MEQTIQVNVPQEVNPSSMELYQPLELGERVVDAISTAPVTADHINISPEVVTEVDYDVMAHLTPSSNFIIDGDNDRVFHKDTRVLGPSTIPPGSISMELISLEIS